MNILFLSLIDFDTFFERNIYSDLLREFIRNGHTIYCISPVERRTGRQTELIIDGNNKILKLRIGNIQKTNIIEKGISTILIESEFIKGIKKYFADVRFDLVLYSTPPVTFAKVIEFVKHRDRAISYLMLKDIWPQSMVDLNVINPKKFPGSIIYKYFRNKEDIMYKVSDHIGCMSEENKLYLVNHYKYIDEMKLEICPNCVEPLDMSIEDVNKDILRNKYGIPKDKIVFVYGGNLGKPQGIHFLIECLKSQMDNKDVFFLIVGDGTEYRKLEEFVKTTNQHNVKLMSRLPKEDYDSMVGSCDVGLIFLDHRFTIPNFPSRLLAYMQAKLPILAVTDPNTDIGKVITDGGFGWWCESNDIDKFYAMIETITKADRKAMGEKAFEYLNEEYTAEKEYKIIIKHVNEP